MHLPLFLTPCTSCIVCTPLVHPATSPDFAWLNHLFLRSNSTSAKITSFISLLMLMSRGLHFPCFLFPDNFVHVILDIGKKQEVRVNCSRTGRQTTYLPVPTRYVGTFVYIPAAALVLAGTSRSAAPFLTPHLAPHTSRTFPPRQPGRVHRQQMSGPASTDRRRPTIHFPRHNQETASLTYHISVCAVPPRLDTTRQVFGFEFDIKNN